MSMKTSTDNEVWLVQIGLTGPQRAITGRKAMVDHVSELLKQSVVKEKSWHNVLEKDLEVGHKLFACGSGDSWRVMVVRCLGPDEHDPRHYWELGEFVTKIDAAGNKVTRSAEFPSLEM